MKFYRFYMYWLKVGWASASLTDSRVLKWKMIKLGLGWSGYLTSSMVTTWPLPKVSLPVFIS